MVFVSSTADVVLLVAHSDRGHFNWCIPLARRLKALGLKTELWTNGMCEAWVPLGIMDKIESRQFGDGKKLNNFVAGYKAIVAEADSDLEGRRILLENGAKRMMENAEANGLTMDNFGTLAIGGLAGHDAFKDRVSKSDVAFVVWECVWAKDAAASAQLAGKPNMGICPTYMKPFRAAYEKEPIMEFDFQTKVRNTKEDILSDCPQGTPPEDVAFLLAECLQGKAKDMAGCLRFGAFLPRKSEADVCIDDKDLEEWLGKDGQVTVISLGSQSQLNIISATAEADLLKGCLAASPRVLIASSQIPPDPDLQKAVSEGRLRASVWLPLWHVLGHENVGCFLSHCGANSAHEGLARGKAIVPLPFFDDQFYIAGIIEEMMGYQKQLGYAPLRKAVLRGDPSVGMAQVESAVRMALGVPATILERIKNKIWKEDGAGNAAKTIKAKIKAATLRKPKFGKVANITPESKGLNLMVKVVRIEEDKSAKAKTWDVVVGDASAVVTLRTTNESHVNSCEPGASIRLQNSHVQMKNGFIRVIVDKWGVLRLAESPLEFEVKLDLDVSATEYELAV